MKTIILLVCTGMMLSACGEVRSGSAPDSRSNSDSAPTVTENSAPVANAGLHQDTVINSMVTLNGSNSIDGDGDLMTYSWSFTAKPAGSNARLSGIDTVSPTFVADVIGTYSIDLRVNDGKVSGPPAHVVVTVYPDFRWLFSTSQAGARMVVKDYVQPGSTFIASVVNVSRQPFSLDMYELVNYDGVIVSTTEAQYLNNNMLGAGDSITITATLAAPKFNSEFRAIYHFTEIATAQKYIAVVNYN